jgi:hypothetical protein
MATQDDTQHLEQGTGTVTPERGSDDEAIALLNQRAQSKATEAPETPTDDPETDPDDGTQGGDPEAEDEVEGQTVEVEYEGKTYAVDPELKDAILRKQDYSRHVQEVTQQKKDFAQRIEAAERMAEHAEQHAEGLAKVKMLDAKLKEFESINFDALEAEDPARASVLALKLFRLQQARGQAVADAQSVGATLAKERADALDAKRADMVKALAKEVPGWGEELGTKISKYALDSGFTSNELQQLTDPRVVVALDKARKFDAIQAGKSAAIAKAKETPAQVLKPGQPRRVDKAGEAGQRFQRSKTPEDAVQVFLARAAGNRR